MKALEDAYSACFHEEGQVLKWQEPEWAWTARHADRSLPRAGYRAGAYCFVISALAALSLYVIGQPLPWFILALLLALLILVGAGPALGVRFSPRREFVLEADKLCFALGGSELHIRFTDVVAWTTDDSGPGAVIRLLIESPDGLLRDTRRARSGLREVPLPTDADLRREVLRSLTEAAGEASEVQRSPDANERPALLSSYAAFTAVFLAAAPYGFGIVAVFWFDAIPFGLEWRGWLAVSGLLIMCFGPGAPLAWFRRTRGVRAARQLLAEALAINGLTVLLATFWMLPSAVLLV